MAHVSLSWGGAFGPTNMPLFHGRGCKRMKWPLQTLEVGSSSVVPVTRRIGCDQDERERYFASSPVLPLPVVILGAGIFESARPSCSTPLSARYTRTRGCFGGNASG